MLSAALSSCLLAAGSGSTGAYFTDTRSGSITGMYATSEPPKPIALYRLEAGTSKALRRSCGEDRHGHEAPIARVGPSGALLLDFGETRPGGGETMSDVFRLVSLTDRPHVVTFHVTGPISEFVTEVRMGAGRPFVLDGGHTERVSMVVRVPDHADPGVYTGTLIVHVQGLQGDAEVPMTITVNRCGSKDTCGDGPRTEHKDGSCDGPVFEAEDESAPSLEEPSCPIEPAPRLSPETSPSLMPIVPSTPLTSTIENTLRRTPAPARFPTDTDDGGANDG
jgi:hypothetical protein